MAFIDVITPEAPEEVAALLLLCQRGERPFTPELCFDVLRSTNFEQNIRDMLSMIAELPAEKQAAFKNVVLSTFERRAQPNDIVILGKKLAVSGGYEAELNSLSKIGDVEGEYLLSGVGKRGVVIDRFDKKMSYLKYEEVFVASDNVYFSHADLSEIKKLRFKDGAGVVLYVANLPEALDVSMCDRVELYYCNLSKIKDLQFKEKAGVELEGLKNLPEALDVSMCDRVELRYCDLSQVKYLRFKDKAQRKASEADIPDTVKVLYGHKKISLFGLRGKGKSR